MYLSLHLKPLSLIAKMLDLTDTKKSSPSKTMMLFFCIISLFQCAYFFLFIVFTETY